MRYYSEQNEQEAHGIDCVIRCCTIIDILYFSGTNAFSCKRLSPRKIACCTAFDCYALLSCLAT